MAIVYSYPLNDNIKSFDELVGTTEQNINGQSKTVTRNFRVADLGYFFMANGLQKTLYLTTYNTSGAATLDPITGVLNIPQYAGNNGAVTSILSGYGMNFTTITGTGYITLGTPSSTTLNSTNSLTETSHTHAFAPGGTTSQYITGAGTLVTFPTTPTITPAALTKIDDTNVTLTLSGSPNEALLQATGLTLGWTGTLADSRITSASVWNAKQNAITTGTNLQYLRGNLSLATFPTNISSFTNDSGYITSATAAATYEPKITAGTITQYWRGDKTWQTFPTIPTVGTWGTLNYPTWTTGAPFVKMTAAGTFSLDTNTYYLASNPSGFTSNTGTVTSIVASSPLTGGTITTSGTIGITQATTSVGGYLTSTDWNTFNNKENSLGNPSVNGYVLSSTTTGTRSWVAQTGGGGGGSIPHATAIGTNTYTATISGITSYADGDAYLIRFTNGNTTVATLNVNGLGAIPLYRNNSGLLIGGDVQNNGEMLCTYNSTSNIFQCIGTSPNSIISYVTNADSVTITKGQPVYAFGGQGDRMTVKLASNITDSSSAQTVGLVLSTSIAAGQLGFIIMQGLLDNLNILPSPFVDGSTVYLGATAGTITSVKPFAPNHLVYLGVVTTASPGNAGRMYVRVQNGYELDELHNVQAQSPTNKDTLYYDSTVSPTQWKTGSISSILGLNYVSPSVVKMTGPNTFSLDTTPYPQGLQSVIDNGWIAENANVFLSSEANNTLTLSGGAGGTGTLLVYGSREITARAINAQGDIGLSLYAESFDGDEEANKNVDTASFVNNTIRDEELLYDCSAINVNTIDADGIRVYTNNGNGVTINQGEQQGGLVINSGASSFGNPIIFLKNGVSKLIVNQAGDVTATKFIKIGGGSGEYLMANGNTTTMPTLQQVTTSGATTDKAVTFTNQVNFGVVGANKSIYCATSDTVGLQVDMNETPGTGILILRREAPAATPLKYEYYNGDEGTTTTLALLNTAGDFTAESFIKTGGAPDQYLMADGSTTTINRLVVETAAPYSLTNTDSGGIIIFTASTTLTIPTGLTNGFECTFVTLSGVTLTVVSTGNTLNNATGASMGPNLSFTLKRMLATNIFIVTGNL